MELRGIQSSEVPATEVRTPKYWQEFLRENLSDEPAEQPRPEKPELPPEEKRS